MNQHFQRIEAQISRRKRFLCAWGEAGDWVGLSLGLSLIYLLASTLGLLPPLRPLWSLLLINLAIGWAGWWHGWRRPVNLPTLLFQVDRALGTGELLCSYHDFSGSRSRAPFSGRLDRLIRTLTVDPVTALPLERHRRRRLAAVAALALAVALLTGLSGWQLLPSAGLVRWWAPPAQGGGQEQQDRPVTRQPTESQRLSDQELEQIGTHTDQLAQQLRIGAAPARTKAAAAQLNDLYQRLEAAQRALWQLPGSPADSSGQAAADPKLQPAQPQVPKRAAGANSISPEAEARRLAQARQAAQALQQALTKLQPSPGQSSPEAMRHQLERLAQQAPTEALRRSLERAAQASNAQTQQQLIRQAQRQLQDLIKRDNRLERAQHQIAQALGQAGQQLAQAGQPTRAGQRGQSTGRSGSPAPGSEPAQTGLPGGADQQEGQQSQPGSTAQASQSGQKSDQEDQASSKAGSSRSGGDQAGKEAGSNAQGQATAQPTPPQYQLKIAHDQLPPDVKLQRMMLGSGVPFDPVTSAPPGSGAGLTLRYDFAKVEPLIRARGLPAEMRELIRQYFIAITTEPGSKP